MLVYRIFLSAVVVAFSALPVIARDYYVESLKHLNDKLIAAVGPIEAGRIEIPFQIDQEAIAQAKLVTRSSIGLQTKCRRLIDFMLNKDELGITYDPVASRTAMDVYQERIGNCLSLTNLFIGMARNISIDAYYVHVTEVTRFSEAGGGIGNGSSDSGGSGVVVHSSHICAGISEAGRVTLVDFSPGNTRQYHSYDILDDLAAVAHFYNNTGYETAYHSTGLSLEARQEKEIQLYETAIRIKPDFFPAYNNLGTACKHRGDASRALQLYAKALEINPRFAEAYSNRASVYLGMRKTKEAIEELKTAIRLDGSNPYSYYDLGNVYFSLGRYSDAESNYEKASSRGRNSDFYLSLARARIALGKRREAVDALRKGLQLTPDDSDILKLMQSL